MTVSTYVIATDTEQLKSKLITCQAALAQECDTHTHTQEECNTRPLDNFF